MTGRLSSRAIAVAILLAATTSIWLLHAQQPAADLILTNGRIVTVDERFTIAQAIAVRDDRIVAVGSNQDVGKVAGAVTRRVDLGGRSVIPGLIDNHMHLLRAANTWPLELRWEGVDSRKAAIQLLRERARAVGPGAWVFNIGGWATAQFADDPKPFTLAELDAIAPDNPVALQESYYQVFLNSRALRQLGIEAGTADPAEFVRGSIVRDANGRPTGVIRGDIAATRPVAARLPRVAPDRLESAVSALIQDMNGAGLTSFGVVGCDADMLEMLRRWKAQDRLTVRAFCIGGASAATPEQVDRSLAQIARMKLFQGDSYINDVAFGESVYTPLHDPMFAVDSNPRPEQLAQWRRIAAEIARARLPLHVHAQLRGTIDAFLDQIEAVNQQYPITDLRWTLAHVNQINAAQLERMKKLRMNAAVHPWAVINGAIMREAFGNAAEDMPPLAAIQSSGITWGLGSDGSAANQYLPFTTLYFAVTGRMAGGRKVIRQPIAREAALIAHTRANASLLFQEKDLGSIAPGKLADLVVLDRNYLTVSADQLSKIKPVMTMVGGRVAYDSHALAIR
ncbi:MAG TPA: amidohydrolase [Vicinamibacterales bacterium]|nr:amidohydrolase [Vicinamibacterales bacterium]